MDNRKKINHIAQEGFSLFEVMIVVIILAVFLSVSVTGFVLQIKRAYLQTAINDFSETLKLAQSNAVHSKGDSRYGVYIDFNSSPNLYTLFHGDTYESRDESFDITNNLPKSVSFGDILLASQESEQYYQIVFERITGKTFYYGSVTMESSYGSKTVYISDEGVIGFDQPTGDLDEDRVKDSRHVHFSYSRAINTSTETISLDFNNGEKIETFLINNYMSGSNFYWDGQVDVGGSIQEIKIQSHILNDINDGTEFSISRDARFNDKPVKITISADGSGTIAEYSQDGLATNYTSSYVSNFTWQ